MEDTNNVGAAEKTKPPRVLVVEHDFSVSDLLACLFNHMEWEVVGPANTSQAALEWASSVHIDVAVLDLRLELGAHSLPVAALLRSRGIPFLFITGGIEGGRPPVGYEDVQVILKPFRVEEMISAMSALVRQI